METTERFIDFYELMQISPNAELETIQRVYRMLAARYHPDNVETGDTEMFVLLNTAYRVLTDPAARSAYDLSLNAQRMEPLHVFSLKEFARGIDGEKNRRLGILCLLYNKCRASYENPGYSILELETIMSFPREHLMFPLWYLKEKGLIRMDEHTNYVISSEGVDFVERNIPENRVLYKLLKATESGAARSTDAFSGAGDSDFEASDS